MRAIFNPLPPPPPALPLPPQSALPCPRQVDTLRGLYLELRETLEKLAGDVASGQQDMARR